MAKKKCFGWLGVLFFLIILLMPVNVYAKGTIRSLSVCGWNSAKNSQELMFERFLENRLSSYSNNKKNMHAYSYNVENGGISISTMNRLFSNAYTGSTKDDLLFFYYSGHSTVNENKQFFGISLHGSKDGVDVTYQYKEMAEQLAKYKGTIVIIMDTCGAENFYTKGVAQLSSLSDRKRFHCLLSCGNEEESKFSANNIAMVPLTVFKGIKYGSFTYAIGKGLGFWNGSIKADSNANGTVTVGELYSYATANTKPFFHKMTVKLYSANKNLSIFSYPVTISSTSIKLKVSEKSTLTAKVGGVKVKPKWKSSNESVATVSSSGVVTAKKTGTANISATINGTTSTCKVTVYIPASITLNKTKVSINKGNTLQLKATVKGASKTVTWKSSKPSIASVDKNGKVTAKKAGSTTITATANGVIAKCTITVKDNTEVTIKQYYKKFLQSSKYKYFKILNCGEKKLPILLVTNSVFNNSYLNANNSANSCEVYNYINGKVTYVGNFICRGSYCVQYKGNYLYKFSRFTGTFTIVSGNQFKTIKSVNENVNEYPGCKDIIFIQNTNNNRNKI